MLTMQGWFLLIGDPLKGTSTTHFYEETLWIEVVKDKMQYHVLVLKLNFES